MSVASNCCFVATSATAETNWEVESGLLLIIVELRLEVLWSCRGSRTKCHSQELICSPCLHILFVKQIQQQVFVPLNQPLGINLPMLKLLIPIPLTPL